MAIISDRAIAGHSRTWVQGVVLTGLAAMLTLTSGVPVRGQAVAPTPAAKPEKAATRVTNLGEIVVKSQQLNYDMVKRQVRFTGNVDLTSKESHLTSDRMVVDLTDDNELKLAHCEGNVVVERNNAETKQTMTARSKVLDYSETGQTAKLFGDVDILQSSERLAKPAHITGDHVDMDLATKINVVYGNSSTQAKVHLDPKGETGKPPPEMVDLTADRIEMNGQTQEYVSTGNPLMKRPSDQLRAKKIRFQVEEKTNEVQTAYADDDVIVDSRSDDGATMHATGDNAVYQKEAALITMTGGVKAETRKPNEPLPTTYEGAKYVYNQKTKVSDLTGTEKDPARVTIPKKAAAPPKEGGTPGDQKAADPKDDDKKKDAEKKAGDKKAEKPKKPADK